MPSDGRLHEPWASFLLELDAHLTQRTELHCLGGFVISELYGLERPTADIDILEASKGTDSVTLAKLAGKGSDLHRRYKVYLDVVTMVIVPEHYESRLVDLAANSFRHLRLKAFDRHDLVLAKLERNTDRDREDVKRLALGPGLDVAVLRERYARERGSPHVRVARIPPCAPAIPGMRSAPGFATPTRVPARRPCHGAASHDMS
jgi:hypothetical protein